MRITLVRHGETAGQSSIRYYGVTDVPLSDAGRAQMLRVREALATEPFEAVVASRLRRSFEAASLIGAPLAPTAIAGFDEVNFGRWEGWTREEIAARDPENFRLWSERRSAFAYPEGESRDAFRGRVAAALAKLLASSSAERLLMVLHKGVIGVILAELLGLDEEKRGRLSIELASIHVVARASDGAWRAEALDRVEHLSAALREAP
jgi:broad specificity phosphatase PhoE